MNIIFTEPVEMDAESRHQCEALGAHLYSDTPENTEALVARLSTATIAVISVVGIRLDATILAQCPTLRTIIVAGSGIDRVDTTYAVAHDITVINCPEHNVQAVAEHAIALMFAYKRRIFEGVTTLQSGKWEQTSLVGREVKGAKLGVIGNGRIGSAIGRIANAIGMEVAALDSKASEVALNNLLAVSDVVCLCLPSTSLTYHLLNAERLRRMKSTALVINVGRGSTIDQVALAQALQDGIISGAALDVFEDESDISAIQTLAALPNVLATPHIAYNTAETSARRGPEILAHLRRLTDYSAER
jgi:D-3-phosphoglycerate dehydrogenase